MFRLPRKHKWDKWVRAAVCLIAFLFILPFLGNFFLGNLGQNERIQSQNEQTQKNEQLLDLYSRYADGYNSAINEVKVSRINYNEIQLSDFDNKVTAAKSYGLEVQITLAKMDEFKKFIYENSEALESNGIDTVKLLNNMAENRAIMLSNAQGMSSQLEEYANQKNLQQQQLINVLKLLLGLI